MGKICNVMLQEEKVILDFNTSFYELEAIQRSSQDYKEICDIEITDKGRRALVVLEPKEKTTKDDREMMAYEFFNYVLGTMKNKV